MIQVSWGDIFGKTLAEVFELIPELLSKILIKFLSRFWSCDHSCESGIKIASILLLSSVLAVAVFFALQKRMNRKAKPKGRR